MILFKRKCHFVLILFLSLWWITPPALCLSSGTAPAQKGSNAIPQDNLRVLLADLEKNLGRINTLKTKLLQEKNIALFSEPVLSRGLLLFKSPGNIRFEFFEPFESVLLVSGPQLSRFEMFDGKWVPMDSGSKKMMEIILDHITAWVKGRFNQDNRYRVSGRYRPSENGDAYVIILVPEAEAFRTFIQAFELGVNPARDRLEYIVIRESGNDYTKIHFSDDRINVPIDDIYFAGDAQPAAPAPRW